ncbi:hypothetical protein RI129_012157 [Pyrocoelia pectoralis]|uniref:PH domain-containing protein n=1 Tax=Pyrocoelia pectoralis TaxID=417401 RepID=A0AAN7Z8I9_9COLE
MNEHAPKPCQTFDLSRYGVRPSGHSKDTKKREESFDLISITDSKLHQFTAYTPKDMQQWLSAIKQQIDMIVTKRSLPPIPTDKPQDDFIRLSAELNDDYEPLKNYMVKEKSELQNSTKSLINAIKEDPLPLPPRNPNTVSKQYLPREPSDDSLSSNYDSVTPGFLNPSRESSNSFSEDDSDTHYDDPSEIGHRPSPYIINKSGRTEDLDDEDEIYDYLEKTAFQENKTPNQLQNVDNQTSSTTPSKVQNKPTPTLKPKLILRFRQRKNSDV